MGQIIASTYEILSNIGSGGGGVVYCARHLRLNKLVVLKADRRSITTKPERLRREVDALKNLSHTYIPQVYDFFVENDTVYTVMDYIEGESADKPLRRGERFSQAQVIEWACQLLEAVQYLHNRPPHGILHSDIKPANIMITPQGDIRLIDFNIALALGENGAVRAGYSHGYASPEHYGVTEFPEEDTLAQTEVMSEWKTAVVTEQFQTVLMRQSEQAGSATGSRNVTLDVRSDIYSVGATLYHLLTGRKPARAAKDVLPITREEASPCVAAIIMKAMSPRPEERYQTAEDMLYDFRHLHKNDPRLKRHRRLCAAVAASTVIMFLLGGATAFAGLKQIERTQNARVMTEYSVNALEEGKVEQSIAYAMSALPVSPGLLEATWIPEAQRALTNALGVYDLLDGYRAEQVLELTQEPMKLALSRDGSYAAILVSWKVQIFECRSGILLAELDAYPSAYTDVIWGPDGVLYYSGADGVSAYDPLVGSTLWQAEPATLLSLSGDGKYLAAVLEDENRAVVYTTGTGKLEQIVPFRGKHQDIIRNNVFHDPETNAFALDETGHWLAVSFSDGSLELFDLTTPGKTITVLEASEYRVFECGFSGQYFVVSLTDEQKSLVLLYDMVKERKWAELEAEPGLHVKADEDGIYLNKANFLVSLDPVTGEQQALVYANHMISQYARANGCTLTTTQGEGYACYDENGLLVRAYDKPAQVDLIDLAGDHAVVANRSEAVVRILQRESVDDAHLFSYFPDFEHYEARLAADHKTAMLYTKEAFRVVGADGTVIAQVELPESMDIYDQQYRRAESGDYLEVIHRNGLIRCYAAQSGAVISERQGERPDPALTEEFLTDAYRIVSEAHGAPSVYDRESGELVAQLETDDYLTYVTQVGDYIVTEYTDVQGNRYGLLLDGALNVLADLPGLCDILPDGTLVFDDLRGNLRGSGIYSLSQLQTLALERIG